MGVFTRDEGSTPIKAYSAYRSLTAAASRINVNDKSELDVFRKRRQISVWQDDAWEYYDLIGEIKYAFHLFSNVLSRVRLYAGYVEDEDAPPQNIKDADVDEFTKKAATAAMNRVFGRGNQADLLRKASINLLIAGECYLVQQQPQFGVNNRETWKILSVDELVEDQGKYKIKSYRNQPKQDMQTLSNIGEGYNGRIWVEHARYSDEADSSMRALIEVCAELMLFSRAARATARSRLNAGALFVPDSLSVSADEPTDSTIVAPEGAILDDEDDFEKELIDAMTTPIEDESSAASVVPLLIRGPESAGEKIRLIKFERSFDPQIAQRAERALDRILQGIDLPKDLVTGLSNVKYANSVRIEESLYTAHVEPMVLVLCDALRKTYLEPALLAAGIEPEVVDRIVIWYDPAAIMTAPDKSSAANIGHEKFALSNEAWRRANGFAETDAPSPTEVMQRIAQLRGQLNDQITETLFRTIAPDIFDKAREESQAANAAPIPPEIADAIDPNAPKPPDDPTATPPPDTPPPSDPAPGGGNSGDPGLPPIVPG